MSYGFVEQLCAALRTGKVSEKALNEIRKGGALATVAELVADGIITPADLEALVATDRGRAAVGRNPMPFRPLTPDQERVKALLGNRFISPEAYVEALRLVDGISAEDMAKLAVIPWTDGELMEEIGLRSILYPHVEGVTLPFLWKKFFGMGPGSQTCLWKGNDWWKGRNDLHDKTLPTGWRLVRTRIEARSADITWNAQSVLVPATHDRTWTLEVVEMALLSYRIFEIRPLEDMLAWCEDAF